MNRRQRQQRMECRQVHMTFTHERGPMDAAFGLNFSRIYRQKYGRRTRSAS